MPTGEQICEKQLFNLVDQIEKVKSERGRKIAQFDAFYLRKLEWLDKEDIIKRVVSLEFNRMIDYYKDNDDIEVVDENAPRERGKRVAEAKRKKVTPVSLSTSERQTSLRLLNLLS
mgnify:CR=1 FL=1